MKIAHRIDVGFAAHKPWVPSRAALRRWVLSALPRAGAPHVISVRIVGMRASCVLNSRYRSRSGATNVLSFAGAGWSPDGQFWLGEIVICAPVLAREAAVQHKSPMAHWAHITVHGVLHLRGYDHVEHRRAMKMEALETQILEKLGFSNPYD